MNNRRRGFTLVEIMLVVIIIGVLAAMTVPRLSGRTGQAQESVARADIDVGFAAALKLFEIDNGRVPTAEEGLAALLSAPASCAHWQGPYLERKLLDPWGQEYRYRFPGRNGAAYDVFSMGADGIESGDDVLGSESTPQP